MKIPLFCSKCLIEKNKEVRFVAPLGDKGIYFHRCASGHEDLTVLNVHKFEILFQNGLWAITDGYFREAISSFVASLEKFYDFYLTVILLKNNISKELVEELVDKNNRSEKKMGAYVTVYLNENNKYPPVLNNNESHFRNDVIHNGKMPTHKECVEWAEKIRKMIKPISKEVLDKFPDQFNEAIKGDLVKRIKEAQETWPGVPIATIGFGTAVSVFVTPPEDDDKPIEKYLEQIAASATHREPYNYNQHL